MAHKALYRAYRPRRFGELKGQENIASILRNQVRHGEPSHAYLFCGPRGTGKTSTAKILACALNCEHPQDGEPCLACDNCQAALRDAMPDIIEMDAASNNSVDNARDIRDKINLLPVRGKYKVYIIDEVHMLSSSAFNALLKTLEEPPPYGVFILATTELRKLPKTVLSRCQRFDFKQLRDAGMVERMREILTDLERDADAEALEAIARAAQGGMRDALTLLEKCCALGDGKLTLQTVAQMLNLADEQTVRALADAITGYQERRALQTLCELVDAGIEPSAIVAQLIAHMQGSLRRCVLGEEDALPPAVTRRMLLHCLDVLLEAENSMKTSARADIVLEAAVMRLLLPEAEASDADAVQLRLEKLEQKLAQACAQGVSTPQPAVQPTSPPRQAKKAPVAPVDSKLWEAVKAHFKKADNSIYVCIAGLNPAVVEEGVLHLTCETPGRLRLFDQMSCKVDVERVASELAGRRVKLECDCSEEGYDLPELDQDIEQID